MKKCNKCNIEKELTEFHKNKASKDGLHTQCKSCRSEREKEHYQQNKEQRRKYREQNKERSKEWREQNKERIKEWYQQNKEHLKEYNKEYYQQNKEHKNEQSKKWQEQNKELLKERRKEYYQQNKERYKEYHKKYREQNKELLRERKKKYREQNKEYINEYERERRKTDPLFRMKNNLRTRTYQAFKRKGYSKNTKTQEMLGVDWEVCKAHIEKQFTKGMNWDNQGEWQIDHIIPLASANTEEELKKLCHYSNLQPLWAEENKSKSDKIEGQQIKFRI